MKTENCKTWKEFRDIVSESGPRGFCWRGQRDPDWQVASSFERRILKMNPYDPFLPVTPELVTTMRDDYRDLFRKAASGLRGPNPETLTLVQWWALGRHCGLITPLLDWTEKPYIAVYFALVDYYISKEPTPNIKSSPTEIAIYRLQRYPDFETDATDDTDIKKDGLHILEVMLDELGNIQAQRALFTWLNSDKYFDLERFLQNTGKGDMLTKILLSSEAFTDAYLDLYAHGIDYRLLFPDLRGVALAANVIHIASSAISMDNATKHGFSGLGYTP